MCSNYKESLNTLSGMVNNELYEKGMNFKDLEKVENESGLQEFWWLPGKIVTYKLILIIKKYNFIHSSF